MVRSVSGMARIGSELLRRLVILINSVRMYIYSIYNRSIRRVIPVSPPMDADGRVLLHLGCGVICHHKFINIDVIPYPHVHYVQSIDRLPQFCDGSVDMIYASHCLEHFHYNRTEQVLEEWFRVLRDGGVLRLSVPDFDLLLKIYSDNGNEPDVILPQLMGGQDNKYNYHYTIFNIHNLSRMLYNVGFKQVRGWEPGQDEYALFDDFSIYRKEVNGKYYEVSRNIEAEK